MHDPDPHVIFMVYWNDNMQNITIYSHYLKVELL